MTTATVPRRRGSDLAAVREPIRTSLDARCDTLRCPPGTHAEWRPRMLGAMPDPRCVEGP